jgi:hypothetical protein
MQITYHEAATAKHANVPLIYMRKDCFVSRKDVKGETAGSITFMGNLNLRGALAGVVAGVCYTREEVLGGDLRMNLL